MGFVSHFFVFFEFVFLSSVFIQISGGVWILLGLAVGLALLQLVDAFLSHRLGIRLSASQFAFFLRPSSFWSSAKQLKIAPFLMALPVFIGLISWGFFYSVPLIRMIHPLFPLVLTVALGALCAIKKPTRFVNPLFLMQRDLCLAIFSRFQTKEFTNLPKFPQEKNRFLSKKYPLLRVTTAFKGQQLFNLRTDDKPHLIFVVLESFRAKNVGCLGAKVPLTPHFDHLAQQGILFSNFHSTGNLTYRSAIASLTGTPPAHNPWLSNRYCDIPSRGLPHILEKEGYHTALIQGGSLAFDDGFEFFQSQGYKELFGKRDIEPNKGCGSSWGIYDEHLMPFAASWLAKQEGAAFLTLFTITNHHPWKAPPSWKQAHENPYLNTLAYTDWSLSIFMEELKKRGLLEKSILFIFGDHGQQMPEGNPYMQYNSRLYQENVHVPLLIYAQGRIEKAMRIETVASQVDLLPTVLDLFAIQSSHHSVGKSLLRPSTEPIFFSYPFDFGILGCRKEQWKLLLEDSKEELYDLKSDPDEKINRAAECPAIVQDLKRQTLDDARFLRALYEQSRLAPKSKTVCKEELGPHVLQLDFSKSLRITNADLDQIARDCPNLVKLFLSDCVLITDEGLSSLFKHCPRLEALHINGLDELTGQGWAQAPNLFALYAKNCPKLGGPAFAEWLKNLPSLCSLYLGCDELPDESCLLIAETLHHLRVFSLSDCQISDRGLKTLFEANPLLKAVAIQNCPEISDVPFLSLQGGILRMVQCFGCPQVTEKTSKHLSAFQSLTSQIVPTALQNLEIDL